MAVIILLFNDFEWSFDPGKVKRIFFAEDFHRGQLSSLMAGGPFAGSSSRISHLRSSVFATDTPQTAHHLAAGFVIQWKSACAGS